MEIKDNILRVAKNNNQLFDIIIKDNTSFII